MTDIELWEKYKGECGVEECEHWTWEFGFDADLLAGLVIKGDKRATTSLLKLYEIEKEPMPYAGLYNIVLDSKGRAACIIKTTAVYAVPFDHVTEEYAKREGEGDKSLDYWKQVHRQVFSMELAEYGLEFDPEMEVVCEEFDLVYIG